MDVKRHLKKNNIVKLNAPIVISIGPSSTSHTPLTIAIASKEAFHMHLTTFFTCMLAGIAKSPLCSVPNCPTLEVIKDLSSFPCKLKYWTTSICVNIISPSDDSFNSNSTWSMWLSHGTNAWWIPCPYDNQVLMKSLYLQNSSEIRVEFTRPWEFFQCFGNLQYVLTQPRMLSTL